MDVLGVHIGQLRGVELGKFLDLAGAEPRTPIGDRAIDLKAGKPLVDIGDKTRLAHLAVIDDVDAEVDLLADNVRHGLAYPDIEGRLIYLLTLTARDAHGVKIRRARQAADMGRENSVGAVFHGVSFFSFWRTKFYAC